jgi:hypothetical protein
MNEPLNHPQESIWPEWHQQPIRLTIQEIEDPASVIGQFFQCYHLPDIRTCLEAWLQDALTRETIESKEHVSTHREIEKLVEAAWVINNSSGTNPFKGQQLARRNRLYAVRNRENIIDNDRYKKKELLIESVSTNPTEAIRETFLHNNLDEFLGFLLPNWLRTALINNTCRYADGGVEKEILCEFHDQLQLLIQALFILIRNSEFTDGQPVQPEEWLENYNRYDLPSLSNDQIANPTYVIVGFYERFSIQYIRRELRDFVEAGVGYEGTYPNGFTPGLAFMTYEDITCLTEAAYHLYQQMTAKTYTQ